MCVPIHTSTPYRVIAVLLHFVCSRFIVSLVSHSVDGPITFISRGHSSFTDTAFWFTTKRKCNPPTTEPKEIEQNLLQGSKKKNKQLCFSKLTEIQRCFRNDCLCCYPNKQWPSIGVQAWKPPEISTEILNVILFYGNPIGFGFGDRDRTLVKSSDYIYVDWKVILLIWILNSITKKRQFVSFRKYWAVFSVVFIRSTTTLRFVECSNENWIYFGCRTDISTWNSLFCSKQARIR